MSRGSRAVEGPGASHEAGARPGRDFMYSRPVDPLPGLLDYSLGGTTDQSPQYVGPCVTSATRLAIPLLTKALYLTCSSRRLACSASRTSSASARLVLRTAPGGCACVNGDGAAEWILPGSVVAFLWQACSTATTDPSTNLTPRSTAWTIDPPPMIVIITLQHMGAGHGVLDRA